MFEIRNINIERKLPCTSECYISSNGDHTLVTGYSSKDHAFVRAIFDFEFNNFDSIPPNLTPVSYSSVSIYNGTGEPINLYRWGDIVKKVVPNVLYVASNTEPWATIPAEDKLVSVTEPSALSDDLKHFYFVLSAQDRPLVDLYKGHELWFRDLVVAHDEFHSECYRLHRMDLVEKLVRLSNPVFSYDSSEKLCGYSSLNVPFVV